MLTFGSRCCETHGTVSSRCCETHGKDGGDAWDRGGPLASERRPREALPRLATVAAPEGTGREIGRGGR